MVSFSVGLGLFGIVSVTSAMPLEDVSNTSPVILSCPPDSASRPSFLYPDPNNAPNGYYECNRNGPVVGFSCDYKLDVKAGKCIKPEDPIKLTCPPSWRSQPERKYPNPNDAPQGYYICVNELPQKGRCNFNLDIMAGDCEMVEPTSTWEISQVN